MLPLFVADEEEVFVVEEDAEPEEFDDLLVPLLLFLAVVVFDVDVPEDYEEFYLFKFNMLLAD